MDEIKLIQHFLLDQDIFWNGKVLDKDDTLKKVMLTLNNKTLAEEYYLNVNLFKFEIYQDVWNSSYQEYTITRELFKDFSDLWVNYLIEHNIGHKEILKNISNKKLIIENEYQKEIDTLKQKIVRLEKEKELKLEPLNNIEQKIASKTQQIEKA